MRFGVVVFPGSNCDHDCYHATKHVLGEPTEYVWHKDRTLKDFDCVILPGGFSYGDYLRTGAIARNSPVVEEVVRFAEAGGLVIGICNGFQVLTESGLLPGTLMRNRDLKFICRNVHLRVENTSTPYTGEYSRGQVIRVPVAHHDGNYYADDETLKKLDGEGRVVFRYSTPEGEITDGANPNGSADNIAGITNAGGNVLGMMPHPERACEPALDCGSGTDGLKLFKSILKGFAGGSAA